jgi:hypothetical protein
MDHSFSFNKDKSVNNESKFDAKDQKSIDVGAMNVEVQHLLRWCRKTCAPYDIDVSDFTSSFADGRALAYIIYHHQPSVCKS